MAYLSEQIVEVGSVFVDYSNVRIFYCPINKRNIGIGQYQSLKK